MKIKIMFDDKVVMNIDDVKDADISESRTVTRIFKTADFKATGEHKCFEIAPSIKFRICIDYLGNNPMPNSKFYTMEVNNLPHMSANCRHYNNSSTCPECKKQLKGV